MLLEMSQTNVNFNALQKLCGFIQFQDHIPVASTHAI